MTLLKAEICCPLLHGCFIIPDVYFCSEPSLIFGPFSKSHECSGALSSCFLGNLVIPFQMTVSSAGAKLWRLTLMEPPSGAVTWWPLNQQLQSRWCEETATRAHTHTHSLCGREMPLLRRYVHFMHHWRSVLRTILTDFFHFKKNIYLVTHKLQAKGFFVAVCVCVAVCQCMWFILASVVNNVAGVCHTSPTSWCRQRWETDDLLL